MKVREVLTPLLKPVLQQVCSKRELPVSGTKKELRKRLAYSYRGDLKSVLEDLRKKDLLTVAYSYADRFDFPPGLRQLPVGDLRKVLYGLFSGVPEEDLVPPTDREHEDPTLADVELYSTGGGVRSETGGVIHQLDVQTLRREAAGAERVTAVSAYYVPKVLRDLLGACHGEVRIVLNGLGGQRLEDQVKELEKLQEYLAERTTCASIRLAFADGVFHTKLYLFETGAEAVTWIGSANATVAGLSGHNEEVLIRVSPAPRSVRLYAERAWMQGVDLECCRQRVNSLPAFFRTGTLYYQPYAVLQKTYNPFRALLEELPDPEKRKIARFHSDFADDEAGVGAFNLDRVFERAHVSEEVPLEQKQRQIRIRNYAVETCYGYWVPEVFVADVIRKLDAAARVKCAVLESWREWMIKNKQTVVSAYGQYLTDVRGMLKREGVAWRKYASPDLFEATDAIERRLEALVAELSDDGRLGRHTHAFVSSQVPEIWEDTAARTAFEDSFFDSLATASRAKKRPKVAKLILGALGLYSGTARELRDALHLSVQDATWYEERIVGADGAA
ncbi:MAG: hypothetical protein OXU81_13215 [Gammaproteobacteria bacterium]|nr:hypothetical protein [Gammaproteobacteria bacterium]